MAIGTAKQLRPGVQLSQKLGKPETFTVPYQITTTDPDDGPLAVKLASGLPRVGDLYSYGNEADTNAVCGSVVVTRRGTSLIYDATCIFGPRENDDDDGPPEGRDEEGNPVEDPLLEAPTITVRPIFMTRAAEQATYRGQLKGDVFVEEPLKGHPIGSFGGIVNSANVPFDPPLEMDYFRTSINISLNLAAFDMDLFKKYVNTVNDRQIGINRVGFTLGIAPYTGKITNINGSRRSRNNKIFWEADLELQIDDVFTWRVDILDRGFIARACDGDPDGEGGVWDSASPSQDGSAPHRIIRDRYGDPITEPVRLNGMGQPLPCEGNDVFLRYSLYPELNWIPLNQWLK